MVAKQVPLTFGRRAAADTNVKWTIEHCLEWRD